jgi:2',3'-cyclic-nucleotide 2'-phosphodiesterase/3'-nucleotidase
MRFVVADGLNALPRKPLYRFAPLGGTRVVFRTGPGARAHLTGDTARKIADLGTDKDGFARLAIKL